MYTHLYPSSLWWTGFGGCLCRSERTQTTLCQTHLDQRVQAELVPLDPILVVVGSCDLLRDRAEDYARKLKEWGKQVEFAEFPGQQHGFFTIDPWSDPSNELMSVVKRFMAKNGTSEWTIIVGRWSIISMVTIGWCLDLWNKNYGLFNNFLLFR